MNRKWVPYILIAVLGIILFVVKRCTPGKTKAKTTTEKKAEVTDKVYPNRWFDRRISFIEYTENAKCRMKCREISQSEVEEIMQDGTINYKKSDVDAKPCPTYALEGTTHDNQRVRIVFGQCDFKTKVITCIDLNTNWECHCPGDDEQGHSHPKNSD